ncbi:MAG: thioesterase [Arcobacteraceae bacterium]|nr:thioesterase [Arcobacteraceae bacterium]
MKLNTHLKLDNTINGKVVELSENYAKIEQITKDFMVADEVGLIHGGFTFCAADFCAMAVVNDPNVVLAKSETKFLAPIKLGDIVIFEGKLVENQGKKSTIEVVATVDKNLVFKGTFYTVTLEKHILG